MYNRHADPPAARAHWRSRYAASKAAATPRWVREDREQRARMRAIDAEMRERRARGENVVRDHIVPIRSSLVCGLNCPDNIRMVAFEVNARKSNHMWPGSPLEPGVLPLPDPGPHQLSLV